MAIEIVVKTDISIENGAVEVVSFPMNSMVILSFVLHVYQRVPTMKTMENGHGYVKIA